MPVTWLDEVHGADVVEVVTPGEGRGWQGDALVTVAPGVALGVWVGDCAPVVLEANDVVAVAHAGWRGLEAGVLEATVAAVRALGGRDVRATLGPCIHAECYEFGEDDLVRLTTRWGEGVRAITARGAPALDVPAAVRAVLGAEGVPVTDVGGCTACDGRWWSHRARGERERQGMAVWLPVDPAIQRSEQR